MVEPVVFQVVGFQNSGKTTFIQTLIKELSRENIKVATVKHHGHGGKPDINEEKDSATHIQFGATVSVVEGDGRLILQAEKSIWSLNEQIDILGSFQVDCILVEGHKHEKFPKAVIMRSETDLKLIKELANIKVILLRDLSIEEHLKHILSIPYFPIQERLGLEWIINYLKSQLK
jgi:molybdopterin-guanine dinucleotide biosynthesis adapter protein